MTKAPAIALAAAFHAVRVFKLIEELGRRGVQLDPVESVAEAELQQFRNVLEHGDDTVEVFGPEFVIEVLLRYVSVFLRITATLPGALGVGGGGAVTGGGGAGT